MMSELITQENINRIYTIVLDNNGVFSSSEILDYVNASCSFLYPATQSILNLLVSRNKVFLKNGKYFLKNVGNSFKNEVDLKSLDLLSVIKNLKSINLNVSEKTKYILSQPIDAYTKFTLPNISFKNLYLKDKIYKYLDFTNSNQLENINFENVNEVVNKIIDNINMFISNESFPDLTTKECRYLLLSREFLLEPKYEKQRFSFFNYLKNLDKIKTRLFKAILYAYFRFYYQLSNDKDFLTVLNEISNNYFNCSNFIPKSIISLKNDNVLSSAYCKTLATYVLNEISMSNLSLKECITNHNNLISQDMEIFDEIMKEFGFKCLDKIKDKFYLNLLLNEVLKFNFQKSQMDELLSEILSIYGDKNKNVDLKTQRAIQLSILKNKNYGDPRLYPLKWENVKKESKQIFISWLAKEDLEFFFNIMFKNSIDEHNRKTFWEQYINSEDLLYSKVILSNIVASDPVVKNAEADGRKFAKFSNSMDGSSCFILAFKTAYIVEFSETGNALYFYDIDTPDIRMDQLKYQSVATLKKSNTPESTKTRLINPDLSEIKRFRVRHIDGWQTKVKNILSRNLRIYPGDN